MFYVYFLISLKSDKIHVGCTGKEPRIREQEHNEGAHKWTRDHLPVKLVYFEKYHCYEDAKDREVFYKSGFGRRVRDVIIGEVGRRSEFSSDS